MAYRERCERCGASLPADGAAFVCSFECTFCTECARGTSFRCPNCSGELVRRARRGVATSPPAGSSPDARKDATNAVIRRATGDDLDAAAPLFDAYRQFYRRPSDVAVARRFLSERLEANDSVVMLAWEGSTAVGFMQLYPSFSSTASTPGRSWILNDLYVVAAARGRGVAGRLLAAAQQLARDSGAVGVTLETAVDNPAQRRYEALGWLEDREFLHYEWPVSPAPDRAARPSRET